MITTLTHKLIAFLMSLYVFLAGIPYGDEPVDLDFTATPKRYEYQLGEEILVDIEGENVGRPFIGDKVIHNFNIQFYKETDGKKVGLHMDMDILPAEPIRGVIKHGEKFSYTGCLGGWIMFDNEKGVYNMRVTLNGCTKVFESAIEIK